MLYALTGMFPVTRRSATTVVVSLLTNLTHHFGWFERDTEWAMGLVQGLHGHEWWKIVLRGGAWVLDGHQRLMEAWIRWRGFSPPLPPLRLRPLLKQAGHGYIPQLPRHTYETRAAAWSQATYSSTGLDRPRGTQH